MITVFDVNILQKYSGYDDRVRKAYEDFVRSTDAIARYGPKESFLAVADEAVCRLKRLGIHPSWE
jgi:hypothetical protein